MSLLVNTFTLNESGTMVVLDSEHTKEMAGGEVCRQDLWGSPATLSLGLTLLPALATQDLYASGEDVDRLGAEVALLLENLERVAQETGYRADYIAFRAKNIAAAVKRAKEVGGGVVIW